QAVRWWHDTCNPRRLYIEVSYTLSTDQPFPVWISTWIPHQLMADDYAEPHAAQPADTTRPCVKKLPHERRDLRTTSSPQPHAPSPLFTGARVAWRFPAGC